MKSSTIFFPATKGASKQSPVPTAPALLLSRAISNGRIKQNFHFAEKDRIPQGFPSTGPLVMCVPELSEKFN